MTLPDLAPLCQRLGLAQEAMPFLAEALTHGSANQTGAHLPTNRRLAFLGDAVLELAVRDALFTASDHSVGKLSKDADQRVRNARLAQGARRIGLGRFLTLGPGAQGERDRESVLATAFEALVGAVFLAQGYAASADLALRLLRE